MWNLNAFFPINFDGCTFLRRGLRWRCLRACSRPFGWSGTSSVSRNRLRVRKINFSTDGNILQLRPAKKHLFREAIIVETNSNAKGKENYRIGSEWSKGTFASKEANIDDTGPPTPNYSSTKVFYRYNLTSVLARVGNVSWYVLLFSLFVQLQKKFVSQACDMRRNGCFFHWRRKSLDVIYKVGL